VDILWIDERVHQTAYELWLSLGRRNLSLVDCASFVIMRGRKIETIFGYDRNFEEQGFTPVGRDGNGMKGPPG
jgi:predicted nucleic acid-binding protein